MKRFGVVVLVLAGLVAACGGGDSDAESGGDTDDERAESADSGFDESTLPDDFPKELIPPSYDTGGVLDTPEVLTASFQSTTPVDDSIAYYTGLLGEPSVAVEGDPGQKNVQWDDDGPWVVSVIGSPEESIIGITKFE